MQIDIDSTYTLLNRYLYIINIAFLYNHLFLAMMANKLLIYF